MNKIKTAVIYARYSSDNQTEQSIEGQIRVCKEYAKNNDIVIVNAYIDRAMSGRTDNRPAFRQMIADSEHAEWNYVLVYKYDRFSRNQYETAVHKKTLNNNGVKLVSVTEYLPDGAEGLLMESMFVSYAEYYSAELSQKVRRGMNETRLKGNFTGGVLIYGYKVENHKVRIDEEQAKVVRYIYEQYSQGVYVKDIIDELTAKGIFNHGEPFARNTIYNILKNEKYSGIYRYEDQVFDNMYPQIVPTELFEKVRRKINKNKHGSRSVKTVYLLRDKIKCGYCGRPISAECGTAKNGEVIRYYKCLGHKNQNGCKKSQVRKEILEKYVLDNIIEQLSKPATLNYIAGRLLEIQERRIKENITLSNLTKEIRQTENAINNIMQAIEQGGTSPTVMNRMRDLEAKLEELNKQMTIEKSKSAFRLSKEDIIKFFKAGLEKEPLKLINQLIKEIVLFDDKMIIYYNIPQAIDLDESQGFSFYDKNVKMPYVIQNKRNYGTQDFKLIMRIE